MDPTEGSLIVARKKSSLSLRLVTGCLNTAGKEILPFQYDGITVSNLRAIVYTKVGNQFRYGLVDLENKTLIPQQYKNVYSIGSLRYAVENFDKKAALFTENGKQVTTFSIDSLSAYKKNFAIIYQSTQQGVVDREGVIRIQPIYREVKIEDDGSIFCRQLDEWLFLDGQNKLSQKKAADFVKPIDKNMLQVVSAGYIHLEDYKLTPVHATLFSTLDNFVSRKAIFSIDGKYGIARRDGSIMVPARYEDLISNPPYFFANEKQNGKNNWTVLDSLGNRLSAKTYEHIYPFTGKIFPVSNRNYWGAIDAKGKEIIACAYDSIVQQLDDHIVVKFKGQYGIINLREEWKITPRNNRLKLITPDRYVEVSPKTTYLRTYDGNTIYFTDNTVSVTQDHIIEYIPSGSIWEIDLDGVIVNRKLQPDGLIDRVFPEAEGLRGIRKNGQYGFIDSQGRLRIANRYDGIQPFNEGLAAVKIRGRWGFISHEDKIAIQPVYDVVEAFHKGFSLVKQKGFQGLIDKTGRVIIPPKFESVTVLGHGNILIRQGGLYGLCDKDGRMLINPKYNSLEDLSNNYVIVERDGKYGVISVQGISTVPLVYDLITYDRYNGYFLALKKAAWVKMI